MDFFWRLEALTQSSQGQRTLDHHTAASSAATTTTAATSPTTK
jgi:hypothetical protein